MSITYQNIQELILLCKQKNHKAQCEVYNRIVKDAHYTEDGIQDGFLKAFLKINDNKQKVSFGACLNRIVVNSSINFCKKNHFKTEDFDTTHYKIEETKTNGSDHCTFNDLKVKHIKFCF